MEISKYISFREKLMNNISKVIIGKEDKIEKIIVAFICQGHVLIEDVPGLGKTKLCRALAASLSLDFKRIQFTPDLLPSDLTGVYFYNQKTMDFEYRRGPLLTNIVLGDEINRATPRTQSALLECMEERQVTVEGNTVKLPAPFFVMATQNPVEQFGTFPLPEAQMDRFFMRLSMGYPESYEEENMLMRFKEEDPLEGLEGVVTLEEIQYVQGNYSNIFVSDEIVKYIVDIVRATRKHKEIELGASPRATLSLMKGSQGLAAVRGRDYVLPEDVKELATSILAHRVSPKNEIASTREVIEDIITEAVDSIKVPLEEI